MSNSELYIGIMSGTSLDGIDVALVEFNNNAVSLKAKLEGVFPSSLLKSLTLLANGAQDSLDELAKADREVGKIYANCVNQLLEAEKLSSNDITAIGSHGQTVRHHPNKNAQGYTLQIGDPNTLCELTGINVVADFRRRDIAAGGEGAPLAPAFHNAIFSSEKLNRVIVNIGGISNITVLQNNKPVTGFDTGPGNRLMDYWIEKNLQQKFDTDGQWAASGKTHEKLLDVFLKDGYFQTTPPKSTGREYFNDQWLTSKLEGFENLNEEDVQATLCELTAKSIINDVKKFAPTTDEIYICGGGAYNAELMRLIRKLAEDTAVFSSSELGIEPCWVEAMAFAWLAKRYMENLSSNEPHVTGASGERILGAFYKA